MTGTDHTGTGDGPRVWTPAEDKPETIGELADRIPADGQWHEAYGYQWKRVPDATETAAQTGGDQ